MPVHPLIKKAHWIPAILLGVYGLFLVLLTVGTVQRELIFLHHIPIPLSADFAHPEQYGLAPFKTRNLALNSTNGVSLGAWHLLPRSVYASSTPFPPKSALAASDFHQAFRDRPTIIYFHGNAGNRAASHRVRSYLSFSSSLDCNVLAIDYRGYGDSTGSPSEQGVLEDARAAFDYVTSFTGIENAKEKVILVGQSLGTGVVSGLGGLLARESITPRALVLIAPFSSVTELLTSFRLFKFIPLLGPMSSVPRLQTYFRSFLQHPFNSRAALQDVAAPVLLLHAVNDDTIPHTHSSVLFGSLMAPYVTGGDDIEGFEERQYEGWGTVRSFQRGEKGQVIWWEGIHGGHNDLGWAEGTLDLIARVAGLE
ncbi:hypothetical protein L202_01280 [Cryptococcus amylolentus CBS 6039]|uniref:AB hydrolase-1 domain-containing protein n=1 Tax=Cryptococcus amylolentus CBS 6039 TaxID=1295533 RepID=A0A1E3I3V7_9TREE|nr:hypothetical protein L202_01280 [Cryptococcus amylolentus CBS 6039]ODN83055.1 hypothetical protein L202_01280 [Cryptococcus amylolentus CBS 6039]